MADIVLEGATRRFDDGRFAVRDVSLTVADGEFLVLVGPSGSGKTSLLRMVAGLDRITGGLVRIGGRVVNDVAPRDRDVAMVFQSYALYPHMTVFENMAFALRVRKVPAAETKRRVNAACVLLGIEGLLDRKPRELSGGQRQRVAMGRALVREPAAFLMDEPLSNLDARLRVQMRTEIGALQRRLGTTTLYVTHDQVEAMTMGDRVAVLNDGVLQQTASPRELYERPVNRFVASFIGSPPMNFVSTRLEPRGSGGADVTVGRHRLTLPPSLLERRRGLLEALGRELILGLRPEDLEDADLAGGADQRLTVELSRAESLGAEVLAHFPLDPDHRTSFTARLDRRSSAQPGKAITLGVHVERLHFFDPATGAAVV